jgi:hypothetical protein
VREGCLEDYVSVYGHPPFSPFHSSPYATQCNKQRRKWRNEGKIHVAVWRDTNRREREMEQDTQDGAMQSWFKVTVSVLAKSAVGRMF